jgi:hypothetical protein
MERAVLLLPRLCEGGERGGSGAPGGGAAHREGGAPLT